MLNLNYILNKICRKEKVPSGRDSTSLRKIGRCSIKFGYFGPNHETIIITSEGCDTRLPIDRWPTSREESLKIINETLYRNNYCLKEVVCDNGFLNPKIIGVLYELKEAETLSA